jgi:hypothetical protein
MITGKLNKGHIGRILNSIRIDVEVDKDRIKRLLEKVIVLKDKGCWTINEDWSVYVSYHHEMIHRLSFRIFKGDFKFGYCICHTCDRPGCFNPGHLFQGTPSDNFRDSIKKGRNARRPVIRHGNEFKMQRLRQLDNLRQLRRFAGE